MSLTTDDRLALHDLVSRYAALVDARAFDKVSELFCADAVLRTPAPPSQLGPVNDLHGRDAITAELRSLDGFSSTVHGTLGVVLDPVDGAPDRAIGVITAVAHHISQTDDGPRDLFWRLRYRDLYRRDGAGWLIAERAITIATIETRTLKRA
ncbi:nuclear transport factor 2 family protein [Nocardioides sp. Bht2]|uniref:nuclear transport factor 2 family protein n=1 Tax=Nocardioides sp. Bht2 TaxID=3392297 RepID=UPI0039B4713E